MTDQFLFRRDNSGKFDLSEDALRRVVGTARITMDKTVHWPLGDAAERELLAQVAKLHFESRDRSYDECLKFVTAQRPILTGLSRLDRLARDDNTATFQVALGDG